MIRDEDGALTGYIYIDLNTSDYGGFVQKADGLLRQKLAVPAGYTYRWSGEYQFERRAKKTTRIDFALSIFVIFLLLYMTFHSVAESAMLFFPVFFALIGGLLLQLILGYNFSVAVAVGYIDLYSTVRRTSANKSSRRVACTRALEIGQEDVEE